MSIASRITSIEEHIKESYQELEGIGIDTTGVNKNLENIPKLIDGYWETLPKVTGEGTSITLDNTKEGKMKINLKGNTSQEGTPTPESPQDIHVVSGDNSIEVCGKNLFDESNMYKGYYLMSRTTPNFTLDNSYRTMIIENLPAGTYTFSTTLQNCKLLRTYYDNTNTESGETRNNITFTTTTNGKVMVCFRKEPASTITETFYTMLEKGNQATTYEEYKGASYPINLGDIELCKIGNYQDSIVKDNGKWYLKKEIGKKDNLLSDFVSVYTNYSNLDYIRFSKPNDSATKGNATNIPALLTSGKYAMNYNFNSTDYINYFAPNGEYVIFWFGVTKGTTTEQAQTILTNSTLYYPLATPTYTEITDSTLLSQLNALAKSYTSQTNISQESNDLASILNATALEEME